MTDKTCTHCQQAKPLNEFDRLLKSKDGRQPWCKKCRKEQRETNRDKKSAYDRARYKANSEAMRARAKVHRETNPDYLKSYNHSYYKENADKISDAVRQWRQENPDKRRAIINRHKAAKRNAEGRFTDNDIRSMLKSQHGRCVYCRADIKDCYTVDHITPLSRGGSNWPDNLQLVCASCNSSKKDKTHDEYVARLKELSHMR